MKTATLLRLLAASLFIACQCSDGATPELSLQPANGEHFTFPRDWFGMHIHQPLEPGRWPDKPFGTWRLWDSGVTWAKLEPSSGVFDFKLLDRYIDKAVAEKVSVILVLGMTPAWASARPEEASPYGPGQAAEPADMQTWRHYVQTVAQRYAGRIQSYQIWNEANLKMFYTGSIENLALLTKIAFEEINRADPNAIVVSASAQGLDERYRWVGQLLSATGKQFDVVSFHLYNASLPPESIIGYATKLKADLAARGFGNVPIWNTETGYTIKPEAGKEPSRWSRQDAAYAVPAQEIGDRIPRLMLITRALGFSKFCWYSWDNPKMGFITFPDLKENRSATVLETTRRTLEGAELFSCKRNAEGLWECRLRLASGKQASAYWLDPDAGVGSMTVKAPYEQGTSINLSGSGRAGALEGSILVGHQVVVAIQK